jgi:predicted HAD superfamily Cof-like phosphohydrolase
MYKDVVTFIEACSQDKTEINALLYKTLIEEEFKEFIEAIQQNDDVEQLDACMDMIWVILGFCYMKNFNVEGAWKEVARSNLDKIDKTTGKVIKRHDGKILKPAGWHPPNISGILYNN